MRIEKHGRSFLVSRETNVKESPPKPVKKSTNEELIRGLHKSSMRTIKELAVAFQKSEKEIEKIISE